MDILNFLTEFGSGDYNISQAVAATAVITAGAAIAQGLKSLFGKGGVFAGKGGGDAGKTGGAAATGAVQGGAGGAGGAAGISGAGLQGLIGLTQSLQAGARRGQGQRATPPLEDPRQLAGLQDVQRRQRSFETGTAFETERQAVRRQLAGTQRGVSRVSGGAGGAAIAGFSRAQRAGGRALQDITRARLQQQNVLQQMFTQQLNRTSQRRLELQLLQRAQNLAESAQLRKEGLANVLSAVGQTAPITEEEKKDQTPQGGIT